MPRHISHRAKAQYQQMPVRRNWLRLLTAVATVTLAGCGGGGSVSGGGGDGGGGSGDWQPGVFLSPFTYIDQCAAPRSGTDPSTGRPFDDVQGSVLDENNFLRSLTDDLYLWYSEVTDRDPAQFNDPLDYFDVLRTEELSPSGAPKDQFHFTFDSAEYFQLSQSGVSSGYGATVAVLSPSPPRRAVIAYTEPNTPATNAPASLERGAEIIRVDGVDFVNGSDVDTINAAIFPSGPGESHSFEVRDLGAATTRTFSMTSQDFTSAPVQNTRVIDNGTGRIGYILFNDHIATAEVALVDAVNQLNQGAGIDDLVLDLRYNGGGFLDIASELAYMIAGAANTAGRDFETLQFNDKHPNTNPVTGNPLVPTPFHTTTQNFSGPANQALPSLNLSRVYVLTGPGTCSASEAIMNSLRGADVDVIQIGSTTCGKPYGFYPIDNCGTTYFTIQFRGVNDKNFGDYSDGFSPANTQGAAGISVPGCSVADDFTAALGDPNEARLAAALAYRETGSCPAASGIAGPGINKPDALLSGIDGTITKSPWHTNRIYRQE